jgi:hypothetical protein
MTEKKQLSTSEFASKAGLQTSKVSRLIREGKIKAEKISGKWMIHPDELKTKEAQEASKATKPTKTQKAAKPSQKGAAAAAKKPKPPAKGKAAGTKAYSVAEFVDMTFLTEYGVMDWLRKGRLTGKQNAAGEWLIDASNLDASSIQHLVR